MRRDILILVLLSSIILFINLGAGSLSSWDEAFYAQVSQEMYQSSNWVDLTWGGTPWADKPPVYMWATTCFYKIFGVNEFSARLTSSISGIFLILLIYLFGRRLFSSRVGMLSALMALSTYHLLWFSKMGTLDVTFTLFLALSMYCFLRSAESPLYLIFSFAWFGYAFLTKGVGALLIPMILGVYIVGTRKWKMVFNKYLAGGIFIFLLVAGTWYLAAYLRYGQFFLNGQFMQHVVGRASRALDGHSGNWLTYFNAVLYKGKPWGTVGLIVFPFFMFWTTKKKQEENWILISWIAVTFLLFTVIKTKLHWYIIPVYPAVIMIAGWGANKLLRRYAIPIVAVVSILSVAYCGIKKDVFTLDYNPGIKGFSEEVCDSMPSGSKLYLYKIGDPGAKFYFGSIGKNVNDQKEMQSIDLNKGDIIISRSEKDIEFIGRGDTTKDKATGLVVMQIK